MVFKKIVLIGYKNALSVKFLSNVTVIAKREPTIFVAKDEPDPEKLFSKAYDIDRNAFNLDKE